MNAQPPTIAALERVAIKRGLSLGNLNRTDLLVVLALASLCLPAEGSLTEPEVNAALKAWLAGPGAMLRADHVELRRSLIDAGLWQRDGFGHAYERATAIADTELAAHIAALEALDATQIVSSARTRHEAERAARKARSMRGDRQHPLVMRKPPSPAPPPR